MSGSFEENMWSCFTCGKEIVYRQKTIRGNQYCVNCFKAAVESEDVGILSFLCLFSIGIVIIIGAYFIL